MFLNNSVLVLLVAILGTSWFWASGTVGLTLAQGYSNQQNYGQNHTSNQQPNTSHQPPNGQYGNQNQPPVQYEDTANQPPLPYGYPSNQSLVQYLFPSPNQLPVQNENLPYHPPLQFPYGYPSNQPPVQYGYPRPNVLPVQSVCRQVQLSAPYDPSPISFWPPQTPNSQNSSVLPDGWILVCKEQNIITWEKDYNSLRRSAAV